MPSESTTAPPDLTTAYLQGALNDLFEIAPGDVDSALQVPRAADRGELVSALERHARRLGASGATLANIERLADPAARVVVTGQQTGLLLGPTYTLSKALTAVRLAAAYDTPERPLIPVFWLASQDHDVEEVDHAYLLDASETLRRVAIDLPAGVSVGRSAFQGHMLDTVVQSFAAHSPRPRFGAEVAASLSAAAEPARSFADWFAAQLYDLLGDLGVVLVDPLEPGIPELVAPLMRRELEDPGSGPRAINVAGERLKAAGYQPQLGRGAGATNVFLELEQSGGAPGRRVLLRTAGSGFAAEGRQYSREELLARLAAQPEAFTPAAGLRPVTQDLLLPTAVFVVGPGELAYVSQLRGVYQHHGVPQPLVWPRATATVLEPAAVRLLERFGVGASEFRADPEGVLEELLLERHGHAAGFGKTTDELAVAVETLLSEVAGIDPTLAGTVTRGRRYLEATIARLRSKSSAALARRDGDSRRQFARLQAHLLPHGQPAERLLSPYSHILKFGRQPLLDRFKTLAPSGAQELLL